MIDYSNYCFSTFVTQGVSDSLVTASKWISGPWLLACIVLSNAYLGSNINQLTAPRMPKQFESFDQVLERKLNVYSPVTGGERLVALLAGDLPKSMLELIRADLEKKLTVETTRKGTPFYAFYKRKGNLLKGGTQVRVDQLMTIPKDFTQRMEYVAGGDYFLDRISQCKNESYVDYLGNVQSLALKLQIRLAELARNASGDADGGPTQEQVISMGTESYGQGIESWYGQNIYWSPNRFLTRMRTLFHSGVYSFWNGWVLRLKTWKDKVDVARLDERVFQPVSLERSNTVGLFYVHFALLLVAALIFGLEGSGVFRKACEGAWALVLRKQNLDVEVIQVGTRDIP